MPQALKIAGFFLMVGVGFAAEAFGFSCADIKVAPIASERKGQFRVHGGDGCWLNVQGVDSPDGKSFNKWKVLWALGCNCSEIKGLTLPLATDWYRNNSKAPAVAEKNPEKKAAPVRAQQEPSRDASDVDYARPRQLGRVPSAAWSTPDGAEDGENDQGPASSTGYVEGNSAAEGQGIEPSESGITGTAELY